MDPGTRLSQVTLDAATVAAEAMLPAEAVPFLLERGAVGAAAEMLGAARRCLDMAVEYAKVREQFGQPIGSFQAIRHRCAEMLLDVENSHAATMLADLGADVVKVESLEGDSFRELPGFFAWNRGKRSIAINLKAPEGRAVVERLARDVDVVMENMRPGVADRLGVGEAALRALNPRLVYCSTTAFGSTGPFVDRPGFDPVLQGMAGIMALQGFGGPPQYIRVALVDYYAAALTAQAVLAAPVGRDRSGVGQKVETSLPHAVTALQAGNFVDYPGKQSVFRDNPTYRLDQAGDGPSLLLASGNQSFWVKLCQALGLEDLAHDPRFASWMLRLDNREVLLPILETRFRSRPRDAWLEVLRTHDIPAGPVHTIDEFRRHPLPRHHGLAREYDHPEVGRLTLPGSPLLFSQPPTRDLAPSPTLVQHTDEVLGAAGYDAAALAQLRVRKIIR